MTGSEIWAGLVNSVSLATWANKFRHLNWFQRLGPFVHYGSVWPILVGLAIKFLIVMPLLNLSERSIK